MDTINEFQKIRNNFFQKATFCILSLFVTIGLLFYSIQSKNELLTQVAGLLFFSDIVLLIIFAKLYYYCPSCKKMPLSRTHGKIQLDLSPHSCHHCKVSLRNPQKQDPQSHKITLLFMIIGLGISIFSCYPLQKHYYIFSQGELVEAQIIRIKNSGKRSYYKLQYHDKKFKFKGLNSIALRNHKEGDYVQVYNYKNKFYPNHFIVMFFPYLFVLFIGIFFIWAGKNYS